MPLTSKRPSDNVLSHWFVLQDNFQFSTDEFYTQIKKELTARQAPGLTISRVEFYEGTTFFDKRVYLRLARERYAFDVCAAPFGREYFFSLRFVEKPRAGWLTLIAILAIFIGLYTISQRIGSSFWWWVIIGSIVVLMGRKILERLANGMTHPKNSDTSLQEPFSSLDIDGFLLNFPVLGEWYERFRKDTYYRFDTRMMYHTLITEIVKKKVEEVTAAKGVKLVRSYEYSPILGELYKSSEVKPTENATANA